MAQLMTLPARRVIQTQHGETSTATRQHASLIPTRHALVVLAGHVVTAWTGNAALVTAFQHAMKPTRVQRRVGSRRNAKMASVRSSAPQRSGARASQAFVFSARHAKGNDSRPAAKVW